MSNFQKTILKILGALTLGGIIWASYFDAGHIRTNISSQFANDSQTLIEKENFENLPSSRMTYGHFLEYLDMGWVTKVDFYDNGRRAIVETSSPELGNRPQRIRVEIPTGASSQLITKLRSGNVDFDAHSNTNKNAQQTVLRTFLLNIGLPLGTIGLILYLINSSRNNENDTNFNGPFGGGPFNLRRTKGGFKMDLQTGLGFDDVAGIEEAKEEFQEVVDFLKTPEKFTALGAKIPRGVLLVGPPGTGKTLLAKAIAGEANVPFMSISGSEFVEMFVGIGASRVRDAFKKAKKNAPCIIFIDEIDAVGRQRGAGVGGGNDEREQTLNQLLTEMDGFEGNTGIIVVAATNRVDTLDAALLRPGRFDRQITVNLPDLKGRVEILKIHARNKKLDTNVSLENIAQRTPGFSGADLENVLNEASILAARRNETIITTSDINKSIERIITGLEGNCLKDTRSKRLIAYHEIGHAITATLLKYHDPVEKVTVIPRGQAAGLTWFTPLEDQGLISRGQILARITGTLGGRVAEEVVFGNAEVTTGANNDIMQATSMARQMVTRYGMSKVGPMAFETQSSPVFINGMFSNSNNITSETAIKIDKAIQEIIAQCYEEAREIITNNRDGMDRLVQILMEKETIEGDEFRQILSEYTVLPDKTNYISYFNRKIEPQVI
uniref:ATP-dependent zinc metalloprotease FtsH n=1 Tax=Rhizochromulina marina TaxID=1034831 RepID=A0A514CPS5_9STRA|nr:cell division protein FtsH [Rhizochromulina marina]QDH81803.1 cell division protein FtsH [Rhizochromulina marina]